MTAAGIKWVTATRQADGCDYTVHDTAVAGSLPVRANGTLVEHRATCSALRQLEQLRAIVERLAEDEPTVSLGDGSGWGCATCGGYDNDCAHVDHNDGCPWVAARRYVESQEVAS